MTDKEAWTLFAAGALHGMAPEQRMPYVATASAARADAMLVLMKERFPDPTPPKPKVQLCGVCNGSGRCWQDTPSGSQRLDCPDCGGTGNAHRQPSTEPIASQTLACALCDGAGGGFDEFGEAYDCRVCGGKGTL